MPGAAGVSHNASKILFRLEPSSSYHVRMGRGRYRRPLSVLAFVLLALVAELAGRALTAGIDVGRHVRSPGNAGADYYPLFLISIKLCIALLLARLSWRLVRARATARAAQRALRVAGRPVASAPRFTIRLSPRLWLLFFATTSVIFLIQTDTEHAVAGRWPVLSPWLHSSALPVFAVLSVVLALVWHAVQRWLDEYERFAGAVAEHARRFFNRATGEPARPRAIALAPPRQLFGIAFESRPPPLPA